MKNRIEEIVLEPSTVYVGEFFYLKVKVDRQYTKNLISEDERNLISEDGRYLISEGMDING